MKFVHIADMHFDAPFVVLNSRTNWGEIRRIEQRDALKKIINYIKENNIKFLFVAGDLYENELIRESTIKYINDLFKQIPNTKVFISPGNHDPYINNSYYKTFQWAENVIIFSQNQKVYETSDADIYGIAFTDFYCKDLKVNEIKINNKDKLNILVVHGTVDGSLENVEYNPMKKSMLKELGFDYIALGHIHKLDYNTEENQRIVYPGSTISLGFDELGQHGMIVGELEKDKINLKFIPVDNKELKEINVEVTNINDKEELVEKLNSLQLEENILYKVILIGKRKFEIDIYNLYKLNIDDRIVKIKDNTKTDIDISAVARQNNLKGLFVKEILNEMENSNIDKNTLENVLEIGLDILEK